MDARLSFAVSQDVAKLYSPLRLSALSQALVQKRSDDKKELIGTVAFITKDRTREIVRAATSYVRNALAWGRRPQFVVMDDTSSPIARALTRERLSAVAHKWNADITYAGPEEKRSFIKEFTHTYDIDSSILNFALFDPNAAGCAIGANRNSVLLDTLGSLVFQADDDTVCKMALPPQPSSGIQLATCMDPTEYWFFESRRAALQHFPLSDVDLLGEHEKFLGKRVGSILKENDSYVADSNAIAELESALVVDSRVRMTMSGAIGDSGLYSGINLLLHPSRTTRERLTASPEKYRIALKCREVCKLTMQPVISRMISCMGAAIGIDNRNVLPPFFPVQRGEDGLFGFLLPLAFADSFSCHIPLAVLHASTPGRNYICSYQDAFKMLRVGDVVGSLISLVSTNCAQKMSNLRCIGKQLLDVTSGSLGSFRDSVIHARCLSANRFIRQASMELSSTNDMPAFWRRDVEAVIDTLFEMTRTTQLSVAVDGGEQRTPGEAELLTQTLVREFAKLLVAWEDIILACRELAINEVRISQSLTASTSRSVTVCKDFEQPIGLCQMTGSS